ncbi:MAG: response regulator [Myxococcota bacterium]
MPSRPTTARRRPPVRASAACCSPTPTARTAAWAERLRQRGFEVEAVGTAAAALEELERGRYDVVVLDLGVQEPDGLAAIRRIRERWSMASLPIVATSAQPGRQDELDALRAEANDFLARPLDLDVVVARLRVRMEVVGAQRDLVVREQPLPRHRRARATSSSSTAPTARWSTPRPRAASSWASNPPSCAATRSGSACTRSAAAPSRAGVRSRRPTSSSAGCGRATGTTSGSRPAAGRSSRTGSR